MSNRAFVGILQIHFNPLQIHSVSLLWWVSPPVTWLRALHPLPSFVCVVAPPQQTDPGLIGFSSGLLHVHRSRMVIIVCHRVDQFAFNPDLRTEEDCDANETRTGSHLLLVFLTLSSSSINTAESVPLLSHSAAFITDVDLCARDRRRHPETPMATP